MNIERHRLVPGAGAAVRFVASPNVGGALSPRFLIIHYTAGRNAQESIDWLCSPKSRASAHLVIARDGALTQLVPFDQVAWHAGASSWGGLTGFNSRSIGIELDNPGPVTRVNGRWRAEFGREYPDDDVIVGPNRLTGKECGWVTYPEVQLRVAVEAARGIVARYGIDTILGHEDISPTRKTDPGPAFPMESFRAQVFGRPSPPKRFLTTTTLNIRQGPGATFQPIVGSPLPGRTRVVVMGENGPWWEVDVIRDADRPSGVRGWVHSGYLQPE